MYLSCAITALELLTSRGSGGSGEALERWTKLDARQGKSVELRFFGGLTWNRRRSVRDFADDGEAGLEYGQSQFHGVLKASHGDAT
jgi:hypothetical protein